MSRPWGRPPPEASRRLEEPAAPQDERPQYLQRRAVKQLAARVRVFRLAAGEGRHRLGRGRERASEEARAGDQLLVVTVDLEQAGRGAPADHPQAPGAVRHQPAAGADVAKTDDRLGA